jgi:hypothetical protein
MAVFARLEGDGWLLLIIAGEKQ